MHNMNRAVHEEHVSRRNIRRNIEKQDLRACLDEAQEEREELNSFYSMMDEELETIKQEIKDRQCADHDAEMERQEEQGSCYDDNDYFREEDEPDIFEGANMFLLDAQRTNFNGAAPTPARNPS